jgi:histidine triad (HIT) family protein
VGDFYCDEALSGNTPVEVVAETKRILAFHQTKPHWDVHVVVVPKRHISSLLTVTPEDDELVLELLKVVREAAEYVVDATGGAHVVTNIGKYQDSGHLHFHVGADRTTPGASR